MDIFRHSYDYFAVFVIENAVPEASFRRFRLKFARFGFRDRLVADCRTVSHSAVSEIFAADHDEIGIGLKFYRVEIGNVSFFREC